MKPWTAKTRAPQCQWQAWTDGPVLPSRPTRQAQRCPPIAQDDGVGGSGFSLDLHPLSSSGSVATAGTGGGTDSPGGGADGGSEPVVLSCAYGPHYSPTLHYPKVVALLKVLFPLPDVIDYRLQVRRRFVSPQGIVRPSWNLNTGADAPGGVGCEIVLTVKEIKDVLSSTGLSSSYAGALTSLERSVGRAMSGAGTHREKCPLHVPGHGH